MKSEILFHHRRPNQHSERPKKSDSRNDKPDNRSKSQNDFDRSSKQDNRKSSGKGSDRDKVVGMGDHMPGFIALSFQDRQKG